MNEITLDAPETGKRCPSGIAGLDDIVGGGLPEGCFYLIQGNPGSGKTTLAMQFLMEGIRRGENVLYITLSETRNELLMVARSHGWRLEHVPLIDLSAIETLLRPETQTTVFRPSEMELNRVADLLLARAAEISPHRVVFDSLSEFRLMAETPLRYRRQLLNLKQEFARHDSTVLLLDDKMDKTGLGHDPHVLSLTHGVVELEQLSPDYGTSRRRLRVLKMRGVKFREGYHDYVIGTGGLQIFPRLVAAEHHVPYTPGPVSSGIPELDSLFGGGLDRGTTTLLLGPAGSGKSSLALQYAAQLAAAGEGAIVFAFDETAEIMRVRAASLGLDLREHRENGRVTVRQIDPAELSPGEFVSGVRQAVNQGARVVVIDSLNGYLNSMPGERYLTSQLHELTAYLNQQGIITILVMAQHGLVDTLETPVDLSYLCDTVVNLRYFEAAGEVRRSVAVIKKRSGDHERAIREFRLETGKGIRVGAPLKEFRGILSGHPIYHGNGEQMMVAG